LSCSSLIFLGLNTIALPIQAAETHSEQNFAYLSDVDQGQLKNIASNFLKKLKRKQKLFNQKTDVEKFQEELEQIPDGQTLLLRPRIGSLVYEFDIYALKKNNTVYFSLADMIDILELAIDFDPNSKTGSGWFLREDWLIDIDFNQNRVQSKNQEIKIVEQDYLEEDGDLFISQEALSRWFDMGFRTDVAGQYLEINSAYPLPGVARNYRLQKNTGSKTSREAVLPRKKTEYGWFDINSADIRLGTNYRKLGDADATRLTRASIAAQGQVLKHEAYALASGDSEDNLVSVRARLSKRDEDPTLLGPLKARSYTIGDTDIVDLPLTGDARQELGFRVSNNPLTNSNFETTDINGDAIPNWDVELYRNGILVDNQLIGEDGRYEFADVRLFAGDNLFEIFFYGPQGEIRNRNINIPVNQALLSSQDGTYDVSVSLSETNTFAERQSDDPDEETPHIAARYNKTFGNTLAYAGIRNRDIEGENKTFASVGATRLIANTIVDVNAGIDDEANTAGEIIARKNINKWNLALRGKIQDKEYQPDETTNPRIYEVSGNLQRNFRFSPTTRSGLSADGDYGETAEGDIITSGRLGLSHQIGSFNMSNSTFYESVEPSSGENSDRLQNTTALRANFGKFFARGGVTYDVKPESQVDRYFSQFTYRPTNVFSGDLYLDHEPDQDFSEARLNLNYTHDKFRTSPFIEIDSNDEVFAGVNVNFNIIDDPKEKLPIITSDRTIGRSMISAFVFHDKDGDLIFNNDDEVLPEVVVQSLNIRRRGETNEKGYSLIRNLSNVRATDIVIDEETLPDSFMVSAMQGVSILPSPGDVMELEFPVHLAGEVDGTVSIIQENGTPKLARGGEVVLYPLYHPKDKKPESYKADIAFDGFYIASKIPPGDYLMSVTSETAKKQRAAAPMPQKISIGYDGDTLYGQNITLLSKHKNVPLSVLYETPTYFNQLETSFAADSVTPILKVGAEKGSMVKRLISRFARRQAPTELFNGLTLIQETEEEKIYTQGSSSIETLYQRCGWLLDYGVSCSVDIVVLNSAETDLKVASK
ncbi:MAG: hypothetical protein AAF988_05420, partial [Pseudomonadota bacterium]